MRTRADETGFGWYAKLTGIALVGAWSTALLHATLVVGPAFRAGGSIPAALLYGTPCALFALVFLAACLRRRNRATAVPFLFGCAWLPVLICAACDPREHPGLAVFGWIASLGAFFVGALCVELQVWRGFEEPRRHPRESCA